MKEALYYEKLKNNAVKCTLCPRYCTLAPGARGVCGVRQNRDGVLHALTYGRPCAVNVDPIEKKPLFHFLPGASTLSIATIGCNFSCGFCQNWQISKEFGSDEDAFMDYPEVSPKRVVDLCKRNGSRIISYTYTEPTVFFEYMIDTAKLAEEEGLKNVIVSNGFISEEPLRELCKYLDAANIDLKAFHEGFYKKICKGTLAPVLRTLKILKEEGVWLEITNLVVPGENDGIEEIEKMCEWIAKELGKDVPLHFSKVHGDYRMEDLESTPMETLEKAKETAEKHLDFVYLGNIPEESPSRCPDCGETLIVRAAMNTAKNILKDGKCPSCHAIIAGIWN